MGESARDELRQTPSKGKRRYILSLTVVLLVAALLRFAALPGFPPGIEHDEVAEVEIAEGILSGQHAIFFHQAYGQEPLFLYLVAGSIALLGRNVLALRFVSATVGLLTVAAGARWARHWFGRLESLVTAAGLGVMLWPVFWSRVGLRGMLLPLTMLLGVDALWAAWQGRKPGRNAVVSGAWFGLSAYTYLAARGVPFLLLGLGLLLALLDRERFRRRWRALLLVVVIAAVMASPLVIYLTRNKYEQTRVYEVNAPLQALLGGDFKPVLANVPRILGMYSVAGDATERNNLTLRPVFPEPVWAALFYLGAGVALVRFRDVRYSGLLLWVGAMSLPSLMTTEAPNFVRTLGALPAVMALPGIAAASVLPLLRRFGPTWLGAGVTVVLVGGLANVGLTARDYFVRWPEIPEVRFVWQGDLDAVAGWLDDHGDVTSATIGGLSATTMDAPSLDLLMRRKDVRVRWCDPGSPLGAGGGLVLPADGGAILIPTVVPLADALSPYLSPGIEGETPDLGSFRRYQPAYQAISAREPVAFRGGLTLLDMVLPAGAPRPGDTLTVVSIWRVVGETHPDLKIFVHAVDDEGDLVAQHDGMDCPARFWAPQDTIVQVHRIQLPGDLETQQVRLRIGLYDRQTLVPYPVLDGRPYLDVGDIDLRTD